MKFPILPTPILIQQDDQLSMTDLWYQSRPVQRQFARYLSHLLQRERVAKRTLHGMCADEFLAIRQRVTPHNFQEIAARRFDLNSPEGQTCTEAFRLALMQSDQRRHTPGYDVVADENLHVYYPYERHFGPPNGNGGGGDGDENEECVCDRWQIYPPPGIAPAPVPGQSGPKGAPGQTGGEPATPGGPRPLPA